MRLKILKTMPVNPQHITLLRQLVEESADHKIATSTDFIFLSGEIQRRLKETLRVSTLKRIWGYVDGYASVRTSTLDILARFVGFSDGETFVSDYCEVESVQSSLRPLYVEHLTKDGNTELFVMGNKGGLTKISKH